MNLLYPNMTETEIESYTEKMKQLTVQTYAKMQIAALKHFDLLKFIDYPGIPKVECDRYITRYLHHIETQKK